MNNLKEKVINIVNEIGLQNLSLKNFKEIRNDLNKFNTFETVNEFIFKIFTIDSEVTKCIICENNNKFLSFKKGYSKTCCKSCQAKYAAEKSNEKINSMSELDREEHYLKQKTSRLKTLKERYNVENPMQIKEVAKKNHERMTKTNIDSGRWLNYSKIKDDFLRYRKEVCYITEKQNLESLKDFEKRAHISKENAYHLDHKYSIKQGFKDNIPSYVIGNICNLEMITAKENSCIKQEKCSISKDELLKKYYEINS